MPDMRNRNIVTCLLATCAYGVLVAGLFFSVVFQGMVPASPDSITPMALSMALDRLRESTGIYPLWQPWSFSGMPTVAAFSYLNGLYYPGALLGLFGLGDTGLQLVHFVLAGSGGYVFLRFFRLGYAAAFLGGAAFMLNPYLVTMFVFGHGSQLMTAAWMPWIAWASARLFQRATLFDAAVLAILVGMQLQRSHVQVAYYTWILVALVFIMSGVGGAAAARHLLKKSLLGLVALGGGFVMAFQVYLPVMAYTPFSVRGAASGGGAPYEYATMWSMHPSELLTFILPGAFGFGGAAYWGFMPFTDFPHYAGIVVLLLAVAGAWGMRSSKMVHVLLLSLLLSVLLSFGRYWSPVFDLFYHWAPFFSRFRVPSMALVLASFALPMLAGAGLHVVSQYTGQRWKAALNITMVVLFTGGVILVAVRPLLEAALTSFIPLPSLETVQLNQIVQRVRVELVADGALIAVFLLAATGVALWMNWQDRISSRACSAVIALLAIGDIALVGSQVIAPGKNSLRENQFARQELLDYVFSEDDVVGWLREQPGDFRIYPAGELFGDNRFALFGLSSVGGYHPAKIARYDALLRSTSNLAELAYLRMLGVRYVLVTAPLAHPDLELVHRGVFRRAVGSVDTWVYRLRDSMELAWFAEAATAVADAGDALALAPIGMYRDGGYTEVYVDGASWEGRREFDVGSIVSYARFSEQVTIDIETRAEALLVLSDVYYPKGWRARVDGAPATLLPVNGVLQGVVIPPGEHKVALVYDRSLFENGRRVSALSFLLFAGLLVGAGSGRWKKLEKR